MATVVVGQHHRNVLLLCSLLVLASNVAHCQAAKEHFKGVNLSFPPFTSALNCSLRNADVAPEFVCRRVSGDVDRPSAGSDAVQFSDDRGGTSVRYAYKKKVQLFKRRTKYAASFSTSYRIQFRRALERRELGIFNAFGAGWAFAITPDQRVGDSAEESLGLFEIDERTGASLRGNATKTVAVAIDITRDSRYGWDGPVSHLELDINSLNSVKSDFLWNRTEFYDRDLAVFIDYDAREEFLAVRIQNVTDIQGNPIKEEPKLWLTYSGLKLSDYVNEKSVVGFSSRVPLPYRGRYILSEWKFSTKWVLTNKVH